MAASDYVPFRFEPRRTTRGDEFALFDDPESVAPGDNMGPRSGIAEHAALPMSLYSAVKEKPRDLLLRGCRNRYTISEDFTEGKVATKRKLLAITPETGALKRCRKATPRNPQDQAAGIPQAGQPFREPFDEADSIFDGFYFGGSAPDGLEPPGDAARSHPPTESDLEISSSEIQAQLDRDYLMLSDRESERHRNAEIHQIRERYRLPSYRLPSPNRRPERLRRPSV